MDGLLTGGFVDEAGGGEEPEAVLIPINVQEFSLDIVIVNEFTCDIEVC